MPGERVRLVRDQLHGRHQRRPVRQRRGRSLQWVEQHLCRRLSGEQFHLPRRGGFVRRRGNLLRIVEHLPCGRVRVVRDELHGSDQHRRLRQRRRRPLQWVEQHVYRRLSGEQLHLPWCGGYVRRGGDLHRILERMPGGRVRLVRDHVHGRHQHRRVRQRRGRSLQRFEQHVYRRLSGEQLHLPRLGGFVRRGGNLHRIVERMPGGCVRLVRDRLHGQLAGRRLRQQHGRPLQWHEQHLRRCVSAGHLHLSRLGGFVRRGRNVHGDVGRMPHGRVRLVRDQLHGQYQHRRLRQRRGRSLQRNRQRLRGRLSGE